MDRSDAELIGDVLEGNLEAFGQLYDRYARLVRSICYDTTGRSAEAQDLSQEVFMRIHARLGDLKDRQRFGPWLVSISRNVCREYRRKRARDRHILVGLAPEEQSGVEDTASQTNEELAQMRRALGKLSEKERLALDAYYLQGKNAEQAQVILGVSRSGLYRLLEKARKKMEKFFEEGQK